MSIKFSFCGDVMLGENLYHFNRGIRSNYENIYDSLIDSFIKENVFKDSDYIFFNFEFSLVEDDFNFCNIKNSIYRANKSCLAFFPKGKSILNIANNHFSQYGKEYCRFTKELLEKEGFLIVGETDRPLLLKHEDITIKFWGVSFISDPNYCDEYNFSNYSSLIKDLNAQFTKSKKENEIRIISLHWGDEYIEYPSHFQINFAHKLAELGFDFIIGHHPHVIQSFEYYNDSLIFYSLGNFVSDQNFSLKTQEGLLVKIDILNKKDLSLYITNQRIYQVFFKKKVGMSKKKIKPLRFYFVKLKLIDIFKRTQMKFELILNIKKVSSQTFRMILSRSWKIINRNFFSFH